MNHTLMTREFQQAYQEVLELHIQIENLFHNITKTDRLPFLSYFHHDFTMISPDGILRDASWISNWAQNAAGSRPQVKISIENFKGNFCCPDTIIVTYEEYQHVSSTELLRRSSTAVLVPTNNKQQPLLWRHLHETWAHP